MPCPLYQKTRKKRNALNTTSMTMYERLWKTMKEKNISQYMLINKYKISAGQLTRLRKNKSVSTHTIDMLCGILNCNVEDIMEYQSESNIK